MSASHAKALIGAVPRRRFAYFAAAGKVGRPAGRNSPNKKVGATQSVTPTQYTMIETFFLDDDRRRAKSAAALRAPEEAPGPV